VYSENVCVQADLINIAREVPGIIQQVEVEENREWHVAHISPFTRVRRIPCLPECCIRLNPQGLEILNGLVQREALMLGYLQGFWLMLLITLAAISLAATAERVRRVLSEKRCGYKQRSVKKISHSA